MAKPLIIGVDVRDLKVAKTGTKTYLQEICTEFKELESPMLQFRFLDSTAPVYTGGKKIFKLLAHFNYQWWKQVVLPFKAWRNGCSIVFCVDNFVPLVHLGYKTIPVFHDAFFFENPENYGKIWLWLYKKTAIPAARRSAYVVTPTLYSKNKINHFTHIALDKLVAIPEGPKSFAKQLLTGNDVLQTFGLQKGHYLLHAGAMFRRKNLPALVHAFIKIKEHRANGLKLVLAGSLITNKFDNDHDVIVNIINEHRLQNDVIITGYLTDRQLDQLYTNALLYVFPSVNEGFGLPVLEAFEHQIPVIVADNTCLPEVGGDAVLTFNPFITDDLYHKLNTLLQNAALRHEMIKKGTARLKQFSWRQTALQLIAVFNSAANS